MKRAYLLLFAGFLCLLAPACTSDGSKGEGTETKEAAPAAASANKPRKTILFFGNSLTAGYGLDPAESFPSLIQQKLDSLRAPYKVVNAGVSGETSSGGNSRIDWILRQPVDIFILELGANDGLRGIPLTETKKNLQIIVDKVKAKYPGAKLILAGMQVPPNMGPEYTSNFRSLFADLAQKNTMHLIPFLLEGVAGIKELNQADGIHPTAGGAKIVAANVWAVLKGELSEPGLTSPHPPNPVNQGSDN
ncbi:MAG: arylesterase [Williamsia sp.]|nr:arylesterase [Williamsia sp.]